MKIYFTIISYFLFLANAFCQVIEVSPSLPTDVDAITLIFDASKASRTDLVDYSGDVYAHTGVKIEGSSEWQYVIGSWGSNTTQPMLTRTGDNTYILSISPNIREFYGVPADEKITQMCFVFRSSDGTKQTEDIFYDVYEQGLSVSFTIPEQNKPIYNLNDVFDVKVDANNSTNLKLLVDNVEVQSTTETSITYSYTAIDYGKHWFKAIATDGTTTAFDSVYILVRTPVNVADLPVGMKAGVNIIDQNTVTIVLYDPPAKKNYAYLIGNFSDWLPDEQYYMKRTPDGKYYWITLSNLLPNQEYAFQFLVDGYLRVADPFTHKTLDPNDKDIPLTTYPGLMNYPTGKTHGIASVFITTLSNYSWKVINYTIPPKENLVIYELLVRDFVADSYIKSAEDSLSYLKKLGVNAVELMPINEFEGNDSWGYNPSFYFATDKAYGTANDYKEFIDSAHGMGMAVIMDIVLNHSFGQSPLVQLYSNSDGESLGEPTADNPWYNVTCPHEPYCWGYDFNHESAETQKFVDSVLTYWLTEYKVDGFRFDFTKGFTNVQTGDGGSDYDASRVAILERIADKVWSINQNAYVILEHFCANTEEKALATYKSSEGKGMLVWGNLNYSYNEATMGWLNDSNFSDIAYKQRGWSVPNLVGYMESHDEERLMYKNLTYGNSSNADHDVKNLLIALKRMELAANFFIPFPGPKMIWQFGELGYDYSIEYNGRTGRKPVRWDYYGPDERLSLFNTFAHLNRLKQKYEVFSTSSYDYNLDGAKKWIKLDGEDMDVVIMGNFDVNATSFTIDFPSIGKWYEYWTGDSINISDVSVLFSMQPSEYRLYTNKRINRNAIYVGVEKNMNSLNDVSVWPNPSSGTFNISYSVQGNAKGILEVYNMLGQKVFSRIVSTNSETTTVSVTLPSNLSSGFYTYRLLFEGRQSSGKIGLFR